jgi:uncharacterized protein (TIGR02646 family)
LIRYEKGPEPKVLVEWRATPNATWETVTSSELHDDLLREQGHVCAYCQRRIRKGVTMHVEHWRARSTHPDDQLRWKNLLGVCSGTSGRERHCDASRGNEPLFLHPVEGEGPTPIGAIRYRDDGSVVPEPTSPSAVGADLARLGLDCEAMRRSRRAVIDALHARLRREAFSPRELRRLYRLHAHEPGAARPEHAEVVRHLLARWSRKRDVSIL